MLYSLRSAFFYIFIHGYTELHFASQTKKGLLKKINPSGAELQPKIIRSIPAAPKSY